MDDRLKRDVVLDIIRRYRQELSLVEDRVRRGRDADPHLYRLALRAFGNWTAALKSASANEPDIWVSHLPMNRRYPTSSSIVTAIRQRSDDELPLNWSDVYAGPQSDRALYRCAMRVMGSWTKALRAAGITLKRRYRKRRYVSATDVINEIKRRYAVGLPIVYSGVARKLHCDTALLATAQKTLGSWHAAVLAAGFSIPTLATILERIRRYRRPSNILAEIRRRHRQGLPLYFGCLQHGPHPDQALLKAAKHRFGSWVAAVETAGFSFKKVCPQRHVPSRYPDETAVIAAIRKRREAEQPLNLQAVQRSDSALYKRAKILCGSWRHAIAKAGIAYASVALQRGFSTKYPTAEAVLKAIRQRQTRGLPLNWVGMEEGANRDSALLRKGKQFFGAWRSAVEAAGISYRSVCRVYLGRMTRKEIVARIRKRAALHQQVLSANAVRNGIDRDFVLWRQARLAFGHWHGALHAAGFSPSNISIAARRRWNRG